MTFVQRFLFQCIGIVYVCYVFLQLLWRFIRHPKVYFQRLRKHKCDAPRCLLDDSYGSHQYISLKDTKLHCVVNGDEDKPLMLFLHGFPDFWYTWRYQIKEFSKFYRTVAVDLKGFGDSEKPYNVTSYLTTSLRQDIAELVEALNYKTCILVGHDIGGALGYHVATAFPDIVDKLIIINSPHPAAFLKSLKSRKSQKSKSWYMFLFQVAYLPEMLLTMFQYEFMRDLCGGRLGGSFSDDDEEAYKYIYSQYGFTNQLGFYRAALGHSKGTITTEIKVPSLLLWGSCDHSLDTELAELTKDYVPNMIIKYFPEQGHWPHVQNPDEINTAIKEFLESGY